jgi:hypothetical protein
MHVDKYHVVVTQRLRASWDWELYRNDEPLPARVRAGPYKSARTAEIAGKVALREFLEALEREHKTQPKGDAGISTPRGKRL